MADVLRQPVGARQDRPAALAASVDGARPQFLISTGGPRGYRQTIFHDQRGISSNGSELGPDSRPLPGSAVEDPRSALYTARARQRRDRGDRERLPVQRGAGLVRGSAP